MKGLSRAARLGWLWALLTLMADQASKLYLLFGYELPFRYPLSLTSFLDLTVEWNRGISYGLFQQSSDMGRWALIIISIAAAIGLAIWMSRVAFTVLAVSLGLIVGGAIGNAIDRVAYGAVFDFVYFHVGAFSWYIFNIADAAIVAGVIGLLIDSFFLEKQRARQ